MTIAAMGSMALSAEGAFTPYFEGASKGMLAWLSVTEPDKVLVRAKCVLPVA